MHAEAVLGAPPGLRGVAVPFLELAAYAGYAFVPVCISMLAGLALGAPPPALPAAPWCPHCPARGNIKYVHDKE